MTCLDLGSDLPYSPVFVCDCVQPHRSLATAACSIRLAIAGVEYAKLELAGTLAGLLASSVHHMLMCQPVRRAWFSEHGEYCPLVVMAGAYNVSFDWSPPPCLTRFHKLDTFKAAKAAEFMDLSDIVTEVRVQPAAHDD